LRTKSSKVKKINVVTLGCSKNLYDSEVLMGQLKANGQKVTHESDKKSDIVVINTCGFIGDAKTESVETILHYINEKEAGRLEKVFVTGCLSERYKPDLQKEIPEVDEYFGTHDLPNLLKVLGADYKKELIGERLTTTPKHYAYLKIAEGCDRPCSFCAIPLMRGKNVSQTIEELVVEATKLAQNGVKELILIAQDLTYYGIDIYGERKLAQLLTELAKIPGIEWIRLHYAYPTGFPLDVLEVMKNEIKICNYIDIPLQHINTDILKSMRRGHNRENLELLLSQFRTSVPDIAIRTTLIVGYPGETRAQFEELKQWVAETRFDRLGVFAYSHEEDTHAASLNDDVSDEEKQSRVAEIMELQAGISFDLNKEKVGNNYKCIFDRLEGGYYIGRTQYDSPDVDNEVLVDAEKHFINLGHFIDVKIVEATDFDLIGDVVNDRMNNEPIC
jgi:ribosomal protein S12 methylthiotransferase